MDLNKAQVGIENSDWDLVSKKWDQHPQQLDILVWKSECQCLTSTHISCYITGGTLVGHFRSDTKHVIFPPVILGY